jgi:hypothetical protein
MTSGGSSKRRDEHGHTPAAWTTVAFLIVGFGIGCIGCILAEPVVVYVAIGVVLLGGIVGKIMQMMGMGQYDRHAQADAPEAHVS